MEKKEFGRRRVIFFTAIDFLTFGYYFLRELVDAEMIIDTLNYTHTYPPSIQVTDIAIAINPLRFH